MREIIFNCCIIVKENGFMGSLDNGSKFDFFFVVYGSFFFVMF